MFYLLKTGYIDEILLKFNLRDAFPVTTPVLDDHKRWKDKVSPLLNDAGKKRFQTAVGSILYTMHATCPDISYTITLCFLPS